ncbi:hypothetical protein D3C76_1484250 [compost metagenome]
MNGGDIPRRAGPYFVAERRCREKFNPDIFRCHIRERQTQLGIVADVKAAQTTQHIVRSLSRADRRRTCTHKEFTCFMRIRAARDTA